MRVTISFLTGPYPGTRMRVAAKIDLGKSIWRESLCALWSSSLSATF